MNELTERRQRLLDQIRTHGPEHFSMAAVLEDRGDWLRETYSTMDFTRCGTAGCLLGHAGVLMAQHYEIDPQKLTPSDDDGVVAEFFGLDTEWFWNWIKAWPEHVKDVYHKNLPPLTSWRGYADREAVARAEWLATIALLEGLIKGDA